MSKVLVTEQHLKGIGDAIRSRVGGTSKYKPGQMAEAISKLPARGYHVSIAQSPNQKIILEYQSGRSGTTTNNDVYLSFSPVISNGWVDVYDSEKYAPGKLKLVGVGVPSFPMDVTSDLEFYATDATAVPPDRNIDNYARNNITNYQSVTEIPLENVKELQSTYVTSAMYAFANMTHLATFDVGDIRMDKCTMIAFIFSNDYSLSTVNVDGWDIRSVQDTSYAFRGDINLTSLNLNSWHGNSLEDASSMFSGCSSLTALDISHLLEGANLNNSSTNNMFYGCKNLQYIILDCAAVPKCSSSGAITAMNIPSGTKILVPNNLLDSFRYALGWSEIGSTKYDAIENYSITRTETSVTVN